MKSSTRACVSLKPTSLAVFIVPVARTQALKGPRWLTEDALERDPNPIGLHHESKTQEDDRAMLRQYLPIIGIFRGVSTGRRCAARMCHVYQDDPWQRSVMEHLSQGQGDSNRVGTDGFQAKHQLRTCRLPKGSFLNKDTDFAIQRNTYRSARTSELP